MNYQERKFEFLALTWDVTEKIQGPYVHGAKSESVTYCNRGWCGKVKSKHGFSLHNDVNEREL